MSHPWLIYLIVSHVSSLVSSLRICRCAGGSWTSTTSSTSTTAVWWCWLLRAMAKNVRNCEVGLVRQRLIGVWVNLLSFMGVPGSLGAIRRHVTNLNQIVSLGCKSNCCPKDVCTLLYLHAFAKPICRSLRSRSNLCWNIVPCVLGEVAIGFPHGGGLVQGWESEWSWWWDSLNWK